MKEKPVEWHDVQGLVLSGYPELPHAAYIPWRFVRPVEDSKAWLKDLIARLMRVDQPEPGSAAGQPARPPTPQTGPGLAPGQPRRPTSLKAMKTLRGQADNKDDVWVVNVALTRLGLQKLGVGDKELSRFSPEFFEGMAPERKADATIEPEGMAPKPCVGPRAGHEGTGPNPKESPPVELEGMAPKRMEDAPIEQEEPMPRRCNILGDVGENSPRGWEWGGWNGNGEVDGMLLLYAESPCSLDRLIVHEKGLLRGVECLARPNTNPNQALVLKGRIFDDLQEHFGFRDGISQPIIEGTSAASRLTPKERRILVVKPGEFVLGYPCERRDRVGYASTSSEAAMNGSRDLARNGSYLVFRQLKQNVGEFRRAMSATALRMHGKSRDWVAARLVGRKQNGDPLIRPSADVPSNSKEPRNDFLYYFEDRFGLACPLGAHVRRANPRDIIGPDPDTALRLSKMHRIIRRGRPYGTELPDTAEDEAGDDQNQQRGMLFICLNANIAGQFELIQHSWINNGRFSGLHGESDPVLHYPGENRVLTIQRRPTCDPVDSLNQFVTVRGGAYFLLPGIQALRSLAE